MDGGERFPLLIDRRLGVPDPSATRYAVSRLRSHSISTGLKALSAIGLFYEWAEDAAIDTNERFGSGNLFDTDEVSSLADNLRLSKRRRLEIDGHDLPAPVLGETHANRVRYVADYIKWRGQRTIQAIPVANPRVAPTADRLKSVLDQLLKLSTGGGGRVRLGLTAAQQARLFEIAKPGSGENPFHPETQHRNFVLLLLYFELGLRKAEPLVLNGSDVVTSDPSLPRIIVEPRPDDPQDPRRIPALVKTAGRVLPLSPLLARALDHYILQVRRLIPNSKRTPYVFLETEAGRPMSLAAVYDVFRVLRGRFPETFSCSFSTLVMRHTFNDRFKAQAKALSLGDGDQRTIGNYVMGWSKPSTQGANYGRRETEESAQRVLLALQRKMLDVI